MASDKKSEQTAFGLFGPPKPPEAVVPVALGSRRENSADAVKEVSAAVPVPETPRTYKVAELVRLASRALESRFTDVWVEGELSNCKLVNGNWYFTLKDAEAQLPAALFSRAAARLKFRLVDGLKVRARGKLSIYETSGKFQLYVDLVEPVGLGALQLAFEQRKKKLAALGLFDERRKRKLPYLPRVIGVVTSRTGAALHDIVRVATHRAPVRLLISPCLVQGEAAPADIVRALQALARHPEVDVIIVGRGGGSSEDLWAFNDEAVARAIAACPVPVISAVGHEVDFTIADFVADCRAATPSNAAELVVPVHADLVRRVEDLAQRLERAGRQALDRARQTLDHELQRATIALQRSIDARGRARRALDDRLRLLHPRARMARNRAALVELQRRLQRPLPDRIARGGKALTTLRQRLDAAMQQTITRRRRDFAEAGGKLDALSPLKVLERGYGLVRSSGGAVIVRAGQVAPGDSVTVRLARGSLAARVESIDAAPEDPGDAVGPPPPGRSGSGEGGDKP
ncbi:MAG: exodeoxyribonuclease VII large subunit [Myxococcales bacterium]|nr:exodeoxyribonuclease VII large subunit [Myxococcales bacterium]